jgi:hypothetical protein
MRIISTIPNLLPQKEVTHLALNRNLRERKEVMVLVRHPVETTGLQQEKRGPILPALSDRDNVPAPDSIDGWSELSG